MTEQIPISWRTASDRWRDLLCTVKTPIHNRNPSTECGKETQKRTIDTHHRARLYVWYPHQSLEQRQSTTKSRKDWSFDEASKQEDTLNILHPNLLDIKFSVKMKTLCYKSPMSLPLRTYVWQNRPKMACKPPSMPVSKVHAAPAKLPPTAVHKFWISQASTALKENSKRSIRHNRLWKTTRNHFYKLESQGEEFWSDLQSQLSIRKSKKHNKIQPLYQNFASQTCLLLHSGETEET